MDISIEEIQKKFDSLSEDMKWVIMGANVDEKITEMGKKFNLTVPQIGQLSLETNMVMLGFTHPDKFEESLKASMGLPADKVHEIVNEINERIFKEIREDLMALYSREDKTEKIPTTLKENALDKSEEFEIREEILRTIESPEPVKNPVAQNNNNPASINIKTDQPRKTEEEMRSMLAKKLSGSFQMPKATSIYSSNNMARGGVEPSKKDPYREAVE